MTAVRSTAQWLGQDATLVQNFFNQAQKIILGKEHQLRLALCALLAEGHVLIEDVPGVGKTTLVKTLAKLLGLKDSRIQFTNDLLPADILGTSVFDAIGSKFSFHPGPIFGQIVIGDELNRATPKTQSALLQAMEEQRVTIDGITHTLPKPFFVVATQNPSEQTGVYPLPESQLDRFLMRIDIGYPDRQAERELLKGEKREQLLHQATAVMSPEDLLRLQGLVMRVLAAEPIVNYVQDLLDYSRARPQEMQGLSPRSGLALIRAAKSWAFLQGRNLVLPEDVQAIAPSVMSHRLNRRDMSSSLSGEQLARQILANVDVE